MGWGRKLAAAVLVWGALSVALSGAFSGPALAAGAVTVAGNQFLRDGEPWIAEGVTLVGLVSPDGQLGGKRNYAAARAGFGPGMLDEVRRFGADLVRFPVSQAGLDPRSPIHDPAYRDRVLMGIALARGAGFSVIVDMQWQGGSGLLDPTGLPSAATRRAWRAIAPALADDPGVMLEIFNEPKIGHVSRKDWQTWKAGMQPLIDLLRKQGSKNVLLVGGVQYSRSFENAPELEDPLGQLGYAVHPFLGEYNQTRADWQKKFGDFAETHPVMATSFNAHAGGLYCRPELPEQAAALLAYLREKRIGLVAWALDMPSLRNPDGSYTSLDGLVCGERRDGGRGGAGELIHDYFVAD